MMATNGAPAKPKLNIEPVTNNAVDTKPIIIDKEDHFKPASRKIKVMGKVDDIKPIIDDMERPQASPKRNTYNNKLI